MLGSLITESDFTQISLLHREISLEHLSKNEIRPDLHGLLSNRFVKNVSQDVAVAFHQFRRGNGVYS